MSVSVGAAKLQAQEEAGSMVSSGGAVMELANLSAKDPEDTGGVPLIASPLHACTMHNSCTSIAACLSIPNLPEVLICLQLQLVRKSDCDCQSAQPLCLFCTSGQ